MVFTTHFRQQSQTTWLLENVSHRSEQWIINGIVTLYDASFQRTYTHVAPENVSLNYNSHKWDLWDFKFELFPLHSPLLGESLLVSFPPLIDMLKFSGFSCSISDQVFRPSGRLPPKSVSVVSGDHAHADQVRMISSVNEWRSSVALETSTWQVRCAHNLFETIHSSAAAKDGPSFNSPPGQTWRVVEIVMILKRACSPEYQRAQCAFKDSMIHWILQFTLHIAFRCVLHRCESQEIRCQKLFFVL